MYIPLPSNHSGAYYGITPIKWGLGDKDDRIYSARSSYSSKTPLRKGVVLASGWRTPTSYRRRGFYSKSILDTDRIVARFSNSPIVETYYGCGNSIVGVGPCYCVVGDYLLATPYPGLLNDVNRAETECLVKLKEMNINLGEALAESKSTVNHLCDTVSKLARAALALRKGNVKGLLKALDVDPKFRFKQTSKSASSRWLELQFAWTPLISDIYGASKQLEDGFKKKDQTFSVVRTVKADFDISRRTFSGTTQFSESGKSEVSIRVKLYGKVRNQDIANLTTVGLLDPLQVAWALVPFSFVLDWLLPIGNYLEALGATKGISFVGGTRSIRTSGKYTTSWRPQGYTVIPLPKLETTYIDLDRVAYRDWPRPHLYIKSPFSRSHLISAAALLRQLRR